MKHVTLLSVVVWALLALATVACAWGCGGGG